MDDPDEKTNEEVLVSLEISDDMMEYRLIVQSADGRPINEADFIVNLELWLHEISQGLDDRAKSTIH